MNTATPLVLSFAALVAIATPGPTVLLALAGSRAFYRKGAA